MINQDGNSRTVSRNSRNTCTTCCNKILSGTKTWLSKSCNEYAKWKLQETLGHPYNSTVYTHTHTHTYAYLHFNKAKLFSLWRRTSCTYDSDAGSMYYIQPVTVRRSITPRIATIITSNHLLPGIFDISRYTWQLSLWSGNAPERGTASISNIYTKMYWHRYSNYRWWTNDPKYQTNRLFLFIYRFSF